MCTKPRSSTQAAASYSTGHTSRIAIRRAPNLAPAGPGRHRDVACMAHPRQSQPVVLEVVPTPNDAPPPYDDVTPPAPAYRPGERCENCARPPPYRAPSPLPSLSPPVMRGPVNPVEKLYNKVNSFNTVKWVSAMVCLGASAAVLRRFPASSLRPFLIYLVSIVRVPAVAPSFSLPRTSATQFRPEETDRHTHTRAVRPSLLLPRAVRPALLGHDGPPAAVALLCPRRLDRHVGRRRRGAPERLFPGPRGSRAKGRHGRGEEGGRPLGERGPHGGGCRPFRIVCPLPV